MSSMRSNSQIRFKRAIFLFIIFAFMLLPNIQHISKYIINSNSNIKNNAYAHLGMNEKLSTSYLSQNILPNEINIGI
ncbi:MAG: hypothetical protein ACTSO2_16645 [Promethearchaeota archaeon]